MAVVGFGNWHAEHAAEGRVGGVAGVVCWMWLGWVGRIGLGVLDGGEEGGRGRCGWFCERDWMDWWACIGFWDACGLDQGLVG